MWSRNCLHFPGSSVQPRFLLVSVLLDLFCVIFYRFIVCHFAFFAWPLYCLSYDLPLWYFQTFRQLTHIDNFILTIPGSDGRSNLMNNIFATIPKNSFRNILGTSYPRAPLWWIFNVKTVIAVANDTIAIFTP